MVLSKDFDTKKAITMIPLDTLLKELWQIDPSFHIEYWVKTNETALVNAKSVTFVGNNLSGALTTAWLHYYAERNTSDVNRI